MPPAQPVGQKRDRKRVGLGRVIGIDRIEVAGDEKRRASRARRQQQSRGSAGRETLAVNARQASCRPDRHRLLAGAPGGARIMLWKADLEAPFLAWRPAALAQIGGRRAERVGDGVDEVPAAVAVKIDGDPQEGRWHELGVTEGARPRSVELGGVDVAMLDDFEGGDKLAAEIAGPSPARAGQGCKGLYHGARPEAAAIV